MEAAMATQSRSVQVVTRAAPLTSVSDSERAGRRRPSRAFRAGRIVRATPAPEPELRHSYAASTPIESEWRGFEQVAEGTPFQTYRMAVGLASPYRRAQRRRAGHRRRPFCRRRDRIHPAARHRAAALGRGGCAGSARNCATTTRRYWRVISPSASRRDSFRRVVARSCACDMQSDPQLRHDWIEFEKMPQTVGGQINPFTLSRRHAQCQQRAYHAAGRRLGNVLSRQALVGDAPARSRQAQAHGASSARFASVTAREPDDVRRHARNADGSRRSAVIRAQGHCRHVRAAGLPRVLCSISHRIRQTRHLAHVSRVEVGTTCAAANFAHRVRRLLLSCAVELLRRPA